MNNLLSYCGLVDAKIKASDKDLPVLITTIIFPSYQFLMGLHMNVKKQQTNSKGLFIKSIFIPPSVWKKITVLCLVESVEQ